MSFMFHPYPYDDPNAFNTLDTGGLRLSDIAEGSAASAAAVAKRAAEALKTAKGWVIAVDGYTTAPLETFRNLLEQQLSLLGIPVTAVATEDLWQEEEALSERLAVENLPEDREKDPVLLYGKLFSGTYEDLWKPEKLSAMKEALASFRENGSGVLLLWGYGALCGALRPLCDQKVYLDTTPMKAMLRLKRGEYRNIGTKKALAFKMMARRCYYVDFEVAAKLRFTLLHEKQLDSYVIANDALSMSLLPVCLLEEIFARSMEYPPGGRVGRLLHPAAAQPASGDEKLCLGVRYDPHGGQHRFRSVWPAAGIPFLYPRPEPGAQTDGKTERGYLRLLFPAALQLRRYVPFQRQHVHSVPPR